MNINDFSYEDVCYFTLAACMPVGSPSLTVLMNACGSAAEIISNKEAVNKAYPNVLTKVQLAKLAATKPEELVKKVAKMMQPSNMTVLLRTHDDFPRSLYQARDAANMLFVRGHMPNDSQIRVGVIGTRIASEYGKIVTSKISSKLASNGVCIVSGMARGVDTIAAKMALEFGRSDCVTIAVFACGADRCYPSESVGLAKKIVERGCVVSAYLPGTPVGKSSFLERNKITAALSNALAVIEAGEKSGTMSTSISALKYSVPLYCVPGRIIDENSAATNRFIAEGKAKMLLSAEDILADLAVTDPKPMEQGKRELPRKVKVEATPKPSVEMPELDSNGRKIYDLLLTGPKNFDELSEITKISVSELNLSLTYLELSGIIKQLPGRVYSL